MNILIYHGRANAKKTQYLGKVSKQWKGGRNIGGLYFFLQSGNLSLE